MTSKRHNRGHCAKRFETKKDETNKRNRTKLVPGIYIHTCTRQRKGRHNGAGMGAREGEGTNDNACHSHWPLTSHPNNAGAEGYALLSPAQAVLHKEYIVPAAGQHFS